MNQLFKSIVFSIAVALPFWIAARLKIYVSRKKRNEQAQIFREVILTTFFVYLVFVAAITVVPTQMSGYRNPREHYLNFIPIRKTIKCFSPDATGRLDLRLCHRNFVGNILLFIPLGILLPLVSKRFNSLMRILIFAFCLSLSIEAIQYISGYIRQF